MGFRFRKSIKILPGVKLNLGSKGVSSVTVGKRGASVTVGKKGTRATVGIPGTGLSYSEQISGGRKSAAPPPAPKQRTIGTGTGFLIIILFIIGIVVFANANAQTLEGRVIGISDGDTITVLDSGKRQHKIRLAEIDAPESHQAFGSVSRQALSDMIFGKNVRVDVQTTDRYGREVGRIYLGDLDVNAEQVKTGMAWVYTQYAKDPALKPLEQAARQSRAGLWADANPTPPWEFRRTPDGQKSTRQTEPPNNEGKKLSPPPTLAKRSDSGFTCAGKSKCGEMISCAEARFYLTQCGARRLDRDRDGVPCESLCR